MYRKFGIFFFLFAASTGYCQEDYKVEIAKNEFRAKQVVPPSPEAAALGKYGNTPVSLYTGTPTISIPLVELKGKSISVPVSISYHASGFKPEEQATWVGSGWSLNAGGVITRSVQGNPDISGNYFNSSTSLDPPSNTDLFAYYTTMKSQQQGTIETQPDIYYFNFAGKSGKFFIKPDQSVFKKEKDNFRITHNITWPSPNFTITDESGIVYTFAESETTHMIPSDEAGLSNYNWYDFASTWVLTKIQSADFVEEVIFEYYTSTTNQEQPQNFLYESAYYTWGIKENGTSCEYVYTASESTDIPVSTTTIQRKFLKKVSLKRNGVIVGYIDVQSASGLRQDSNFPEDRLLQGVKLYNKQGTTDKLIQHFSFTQSYFINNANVVDKKRLRLDSLYEKTVDGTILSKPPYAFSYNTNVAIPERFTPALDHWGFFNASTNTSLLPNFTVDRTPYSSATVGKSANREPGLSGATCTMLTKITYPTGGYTTFDYELHRAKFDDNSIHDVGGLRIKEITDYSFENKKALRKVYEYLNDNGETSGRAGIMPIYKQTTNFQHYLNILCTPGDCPCLREGTNYALITTTVSASSIKGLGSTQGSHIGYTKVTETINDITTGQPLGKTVHNFNVGTFMEFDEDIAAGDMSSQQVYNNAGKLLKEIVNTYQYGIQGNISGWFVKPALLQDNKAKFCRTTSNTFLNYGDWVTPDPSCVEFKTYYTKLFTQSYGRWSQFKQLTQQVEKIYDQATNTYLTNTKKFTYGNTAHTYPTKIEQTTSNNEMVVTEKQYAGDYTTTTVTNNAAIGIFNLIDRNMLVTEIESFQYRQNSDGSNKRYLSGSLNTYLPSQPYPDKVYRLETNAPLTSFQKSTINGSGAFTQDANYKLTGSFSYNSFNNLTEQLKTDDMPQAYIWGYNYGYPVAQISGANYANIISEAGLDQNILQNPSSDVALRTELNKIRTTFPNALVTIFTYQPQLGISSTADANNRVTSYEYDGFNRLVNIKDHSGHIAKNFKYNYNVGAAITASTPSLFYSPALGGNFVRTGCLNGRKALPVYYSIPYGKYISSINQADADAKANTDYTTNGQALADQQPCLYYNVLKSGFYKRNNCGGMIGTGVTYIVPADTYSSNVSQTDADNLAQNDVNTNGQAYANVNATCLPAVTINYANGSGGVLKPIYTHASTGTPYSFILSAGTGTIQVPEGIYSVNVVVAGATGPFEFNLGCMVASSANNSMIFQNVNISNSSCNVLSVSNNN